MSSMTKVLVTTKMMQDVNLFADLEGVAELIFVDPPQFLSEQDCLELVDGVNVWICGDDRLTRRVAERASNSMKLVVKWGAGYDSIDTLALKDFNIDFRHTPNVLSNAVAEYALGLTLVLLRQIHVADQEVRSGRWTKVTGQELSGKTVGIVGYGSIGRATGKKFAALGCKVVHSDPKSANSIGLKHLLQDSQIIVICADLNSETRGMIGFEEFSLMRRDAYLINVSRGELILEPALVNAIYQSEIRAAALDVFWDEPLRSTHPLADKKNVLLAPHNASNTSDAISRANEMVFDHLRNWGLAF